MNFKLEASGKNSQEFLKIGISNFYDAMQFVKNLPYGRNENRYDFKLVLKEKKGSCSSKHGLLKELAAENNFDQIKLVLGIFYMNGIKYPKISKRLNSHTLSYIPEAHTYLKCNGEIFDCTTANSSKEDFLDNLVFETEIQAEDLVERKIEIHQDFLKTWCKKEDLDFNRIWEIRENCILDLSN